ncbi:hypothetical protein J3458_022193 [Metarhizium acridum]|uniref:uncharacterized protein n=1 Tax=Metarhizium acridum TaxID=92637 RepID=UPI001C6B3253|nr:hypothetical protein J3458_022193 [Metarhizium acridum]
MTVKSAARCAAQLADNKYSILFFDPILRLSGLAVKVIFEQENDTDGPELKPEQVEVQVHASRLDEECVRIIAGTEFKSNFSHEIAGVVTRIGSAVTKFKQGDRVLGFSGNKFASFQVTNQLLIHKVHEEEQASRMASLPKAYGMAAYGLETLLNLQPAEKVVVLPGTGFPGEATVNTAKALGGKPYVAVQSDSEVQLAMKRFSLSQIKY